MYPKKALHRRQLLREDEKGYKNNLISQTLLTDNRFINASILLVYLSTQNEVSTTRLIKEAWRLGKRVAAPKVIGNQMEFYFFSSFDQLKIGSFGILEPIDTTQLVLESNALVIMPGVAFDDQRNRIGYGKGYYDRYLSEHPLYQTIALAFDCQLVKEIPCEPHDLKPNIILTETRIIK